jgi:hypothetical protein
LGKGDSRRDHFAGGRGGWFAKPEAKKLTTDGHG